MIRSLAYLLSIGTALTLVTATIAEAQAPNPNVSVRNRDRPDFDPLGLRLGSFLFYPELELRGEYDDNVFADDGDEEDDFGLIASPTFSLLSQLNNHALNFQAGAESARYLDFDQNDYDDFFAETDGRLDILRNVDLQGGLRFARDHENRDDFDADRSAEALGEDLVEINRYTGELYFNQRFNRVFYRIGGSAQRTDYINDGDLDQSGRDRDRYQPSVRVGWDVSPRFDVFTEAAYYKVEYDDTAGNRDFDGWRAGVGANFDITAVFFGELFVGYERATFDNEEFDEAEGPAFGAGLTWNVTQLTTIELIGSRAVEATTDVEAGGNLRTDVELRVDHELLRNVIVNGRTAFEQDDADGDTEDTYRVGAGVDYLLNRNLSVGLDYEFATRNSDFEDSDYDRNRIWLGVTARL